MNSFKQYIRETIEAPSDPRDNAPRTLLVTVEDLRNALAILGDDRTIEVKIDSPEFDSITVNLIPPGEERDLCPDNVDAPPDQHENLSSTFELSIVQVRDDLPDLRDYATVEVTLDKNDPDKFVLTFRRDEERGD